MIGNLFYGIFFQPIVNLLVIGYKYIPDVGVVIILITLIIRLILAPSMHKSLKSQSAMSALQPKLNEIREKYKDDREAQAKAMMDLYKEHSVNPFSSCLPLLLQLPFLIALYQVFLKALGGSGVSQYLYHFVKNPGNFNPYFLHFVNLAKPSLVLGILAGVTQYWQSRIMMPKDPSNDFTTRALQQQTLYILPLLTVIISLRLPAGLPLYWITTTLFGVAQQYYIMRNNNPVKA